MSPQSLPVSLTSPSSLPVTAVAHGAYPGLSYPGNAYPSQSNIAALTLASSGATSLPLTPR